MVFIYGSENIKRTEEIPGLVVFLSGLSYFQLCFEHTVERLRFVTGDTDKKRQISSFFSNPAWWGLGVFRSFSSRMEKK